MTAHAVRAGELNRQVTIVKRTEGARDAGGAPAITWVDQTPSLWAKRTDISDAERLRGGGVTATLRARFVVRAEDAGDVKAKDRIRDEDFGETFEIIGAKRLDSEWREITAGAQANG